MKWIIAMFPMMLFAQTGADQIISLQNGTGAKFVTVQSVLNTIARVTDYGVSSSASANQTSAIQNAINSANIAGFNSLYFPPGTYAFTSISVPNKFSLECATDSALSGGNAATLKGLSAANMIVLAGSYSSVEHCNINGNSLATSGTFSQSLIFHTIRDNSFYGFVAGTAAIKGGGMLYMTVTGNRFASIAGRCVDIQNSYSSGGTSYGVNVADFRGNVGTSCAQGYRISGTFTFDTNDWEGTLPSGTRAALDFSENAISTYATVTGNYLEGGSTAGTGYGIFLGGGTFVISGNQILFTHGGTNTCISLDVTGTSVSLLDANIFGNHMRKCDVGIYIDTVPLYNSTFKGNIILAGNMYRENGTAFCQIGTDTTALAFLQATRNGNDCPSYSGTQAWTPVLSFGGASTGITYATQAGTWQYLNGVLYATAHIVLTSKGSSTGGARIAGMPFDPSASVIGYGTFAKYNGMSSITNPFVQATNAFGFDLHQTGAANDTNLLDTNFGNATEIWVQVTYTP